VEHVVFFTGADGAAQFRRTPSLEEAVRVVEHLRNVEGVEDSRVYALAEVPLAFKTVYRVEIAGQSEAPAAPLPPMPPMPEMPELGVPAAEAPAAEEPVLAAVPSEPFAAEPAPEPVSNGRRGNGFFAR
jgi:hypothetical protein